MAVDDEQALSEEIYAAGAFKAIRLRLAWLLGLTLLGGLLGLFLSLLQPPVYEARAVFTVNIDLAKTGPLDQLSQDQLIGAAYTLIGSTNVLTQTLQDAQAAGIDVPALTYFDNIYLERRQAQILLRVRDKDPQAAAKIANLWAENANQALIEAADHAMQFTVLWEYLTTLGDCPQITGTAIPVPNICGNGSYAEVHQIISSSYLESERQRSLAHGIISALNFTLSRQAQAPVRPVAYGRNTAVLGGVLIGFLAGIVLLSAWRRKQR